MARPITFEELFDPEFLSALAPWSFAVRRVSPAGRHGARLSPDRGGGIEFKDYRPYTPGDDLRTLDWNLYQRLGKAFVRLCEQEENLPVHLLPDLSGSMFHADAGPPPIVAALRCTLALAAIGLNHHDSVGLHPFGEQLQTVFRAKSGHTQIMSVARHLARLADTPPRQHTNLTAALHRFSGLGLRRGLLVVISDCFDPGGISALRRAFQSVRHRVLIVQLTRPTDAEPALSGEVNLVDCETGAQTRLTITTSALDRYRAAYADFNLGLDDIARRQGGRVFRIDTHQPVLPQLGGLQAIGEVRV